MTSSEHVGKKTHKLNLVSLSALFTLLFFFFGTGFFIQFNALKRIWLTLLYCKATSGKLLICEFGAI